MLKWRHFRNYFGIGAPDLAVRPRFAWCAYTLGGAAVAFIVVLSALLAFFFFRDPGNQQDVSTLQARIRELENMLEQGGGAMTNLEVTYSANRQLSEELRILSDNQAVLEDDLSYLLGLVPVGAREGETRLDRLVVWPDAVMDQTYRFSVLVGYESGRKPQEFNGVLKFILTVSRNGKALQLPWPDKSQAGRPEYQVKVRHWTRKTGILEIAPGDVLKKVELKLMQGNTQRAVAAVNF
jgi:hypothetical protein